MHELGVASEVLRIALSEASRHGARRITAVKLRVGVLRGIVPEHMVFLFGHLAAGTIADGATLEIEEEPVRTRCELCGEGRSALFGLECPTCGRSGVGLSGGDSLAVASIDLDL